MIVNLPLRILSLLLIVGAPLTFSACGNQEKDHARVVPSGALRGEVHPAGALVKVTATSSTGQPYEFVPPTSTAAFQLDKLPAGDYTLSFETTLSYNTPESRRVAVRAGQTTVVPPLMPLSTGHFTGEISWVLNGQTYRASQLMGQIQNDYFVVTGHLPQSGGTGYEQIRLLVAGFGSLPNPFRGAGTYPLGLSEWTTGSYIQKVNNGIPATYSTYLQGPTAGSVTIAELDPVARQATGTFSFTAAGWLNATGTRQITNGRFRFSY